MTLHSLETYINQLRSFRKKGEKAKEEVKLLGNIPLWQEHELATALYALLCQEVGLPSPSLSLKALSSGAVPFFERGCFPWGALPYPREHAEIGIICSKLGKQEIAEGIKKWQRTFAIAHDHQPLCALFSQENGYNHVACKEANALLLGNEEKKPLTEGIFLDKELGLVVARTHESTVLCSAVGCKSGMGTFLFQDTGIINFGPQTYPLGNCEGFGLAGKPYSLEISETLYGFQMQYQTRLASPHPRGTGFAGLKDSGYSGLWAEVACQYENQELSFHCTLEGTASLEKRVFVFFGKGNACYVAGTHKLNPRSLDRYKGPIQPVIFQGREKAVSLEMQGGGDLMEIIPLAGGECFWSADFLVAYSFSHPTHQYRITSL